MSKKKRVKINKELIKDLILWGSVAGLILAGAILIWTTTLNLPDLNSFDERRVAQSTKIYDRTGEVVLYDVFGDYKRSVIDISEMSPYILQATVAVEDQDFYEHNGIQISAIFRAIRNNILSGDLLTGQGGSTITQQVLKNALLTTDKKISRKLKEWVLAPRLESVLSKEEILEIYLNEVPYGGSVYGIQEASRRFFGKDAKDLTLVESAYLAALPQAPTYYSPYGNNLSSLKIRKNHVLDQMEESGYITKDERDIAKQEEVTFQKQEDYGIKAPHFVIYIREFLEQEYGKEVIEEGGLKVITTLDWELQEEAEKLALENALNNKERYDAENISLVATDPNTGEILVMVGSRNYFDEEIDGNFNIATAKRQPGSTFKPIVYAEAFNKGYRPETVVFDLPTEFSTSCDDDPESCYSPVNYDDKFRGPMSLRDALAQSINVPAVKVLYLAGLRDALNLAKNMGISTLGDINQYGLTLVLGGGEVTPMDMAKAYGVFATEGIRRDLNGILKIEDREGNILYEPEIDGERVMSEDTARLVSSILSDDVAKRPSYSTNSVLYFNGRVASKTGTTNDFRDTWTIGYTPNIVAVAWAGNNDNRSIDKTLSGLVISPYWSQFMNIALEKMEHESFTPPSTIDPEIKPILAGYWKGEETEVYDVNTGKPADEDTKDEDKTIAVVGGGGEIHSILYWVDKNDPLGDKPSRPERDGQYQEWEDSVRAWVNRQNISGRVDVTDTDDIKRISLELLTPINNKIYEQSDRIVISSRMSDRSNISNGEVYINGEKVADLDSSDAYSFIPEDVDFISDTNELEVKVISNNKEYTENLTFFVN